MQCEPGVTTNAESLVRTTKVLTVEPLYSHVQTSNTFEARISGARVLVRPPSGVTAEDMTRMLQCQGARLLLGRVQEDAAADYPYWLPDRWVNVQVTLEDGNFAVIVRADSVTDNLRILARISRYGEQQMVGTATHLP